MDASVGYSPEGVFKKKLTDKIHNGLKVYEIIDGEVTGISLVKKPANEIKAKIVSEKDRIIAGVLLKPDKLIYRINPITGEEFYIYFTKSAISKLYTKYRKKNWTSNEYISLAKMYAKQLSEDEIASKLDRNKMEVLTKIKDGGTSFRNMIIILMSQDNKTTKVISERLGISHSELIKIVANMGGELKKTEDQL